MSENKKYVLGIDVGTTCTKSILFDNTGKIISSSMMPYNTYNDIPLQMEQDAEDWYKTLKSTVCDCLKSCDNPENVVAMCVSTQGGTVVPVDSSFNPLRRAIVWSDDRCEKERDEFIAEFGEPYLYEVSGWFICMGMPVLEAMWIKKNEPEIFSKTRYFLTVPTYVSYKLTGKIKVDVSNAGIDQFFDVRNLEYPQKLLDYVGISRDMLPEVVNSGEIIGTLSQTAAKELGLTTNTILCTGAHDQYCVALGAGLLNPGDSMIGTGTSWVVTGIREKCPANHASHISFSRHSVPGLWGGLISLSSAGSSLKWFKNKCLPGGEELDYKTLDDECCKRILHNQGLIFYPYMTASNYPCATKDKGGTFIGLSFIHDIYDMALSVMEGIVFQTAWMLEAVCGNGLSSIKMTGGATNSKLWVQIVANVTGLPIQIPSVADMGCVGAAMLAGIAGDVFESYSDAAEKMAPEYKTVLPDDNKDYYQKKYKKFKEKHGGIYES